MPRESQRASKLSAILHKPRKYAWYFFYFCCCQSYQCDESTTCTSRVFCNDESKASWITFFEICVSDEGAERTLTSIRPASDSPWARQAAGNGHRAPEFARAATQLRNLWGSRSAINKSGWGGPSGNNIFQQRSPDVMPCGLYKYPEPIRAMWTVFHPPTPFPFECLPSARSEKQALLCFVCPSALTSHFLPVNCQCSKAEHWKPHVKQISLGFTM